MGSSPEAASQAIGSSIDHPPHVKASVANLLQLLGLALEIALVRQSRLSVMPLKAAEFDQLLAMGGISC